MKRRKKLLQLCSPLLAAVLLTCTAVSAFAESEPLEAVPLSAEPVTEDTAPADTGSATLGEGMMNSYLTGLPVSTEVGQRRPFAVMINNLQPAIPQSGISKADLLYEVMVEGSITRLMAVFQDIASVGQLGPVRSSRHYFIWMADDTDSIYTHFGWSGTAQKLIEDEGRQTINGTFYDGDGNFYRTSDREAPHNAYVTGQGLINIATSNGIPQMHPDGYVPNLKFNAADTPLASGEDAYVVNIPFAYDTPWFNYNQDTGLYERYEYGSPHIDMENNEQLAFKNIIVVYVDQWVFTDYGHLDMNYAGENDGLYITDGKAIPIRSVKPGWEYAAQYYDMNGNEIYLNPGKTMFEIVPSYSTVTFGDTAPVYGNSDETVYSEDGGDVW